LFFIDLDKFKDINDKFGHDGGDLLLKKIASRISSCLRETDVVARVGGDEFTVILTNSHNAKQAKIIAEKLLSEIMRPAKIKREMVSLSASIGITLSLKDGNESDVLLGHADRAMYVAKNLGGNQYSFHSNARLKT